MDKPIANALPADLPQNWATNQIVSPNGTDVGLDAKHGYNYQSQQINAAQEAINTLNNALLTVPSSNDPAKDTPVDADSLALIDSADAGKTKRLLWSKLKAALSGVLAPASHNHAAGDINSGLLAIARGGTNAGTAADARTNLGACSTPVRVVVTMPSTGWVKNSTTTCYEQTVAVAGLLATDSQATVHIEPVGSTDQAAQLLTDEAYAAIFTKGGYEACTTNGQLYCRGPAGGDAPGVDFQIAVCMAR